MTQLDYSNVQIVQTGRKLNVEKITLAEKTAAKAQE